MARNLLFGIKFLMGLPCAIFSLATFFVVRLLLRAIARLHSKMAKKNNPGWKVLSEELLYKPLVLPLIMVTGPRWNPHAVISSTGPHVISSTLRIGPVDSQQAGDLQSITLYQFNGMKTMQQMQPIDWQDPVQVRPGKYNLVYRYYATNKEFILPRIEIDGKTVAEESRVAANNNRFLGNYKSRPGIFYYLLAYHIIFFLKYPGVFSRKLISNFLLPVGSVDTQFFYGMIQSPRMNVLIKEELLNKAAVFLTVYNGASFPIKWTQIEQPLSQHEIDHRTGKFYIIRVRNRDLTLADWPTETVCVTQKVESEVI